MGEKHIVTDRGDPVDRDRWARLRFAIIGPLLAAPPPKGELQAMLRALSARTWQHPVSGQPIRFGVSTLERWHAWWVHEFVDTRFWVIAHGQFMPPVEVAALPASLLARFDSSDLASQLTATLRFLAPLGEGR